jgi:hypothetical protein
MSLLPCQKSAAARGDRSSWKISRCSLGVFLTLLDFAPGGQGSSHTLMIHQDQYLYSIVLSQENQ